ncbi:MAG TPA: PKD domain-containing protein, partial [Puia sp.]
ETAVWTWNHYGFFFTLPPGVNTAIVRIIDNNPGGSNLPGNDFALDDITFRPCGPVITGSLAAGSPGTVCPGASVSFTGNIAAGGYTNPAFLWQISADTGKTWTDMPGSNQLLLTTNAPPADQNIAYQYRMVAAEATNIGSPSCRVASNPTSVVVLGSPNTDFGFYRSACDPLLIEFTGSATPGTSYTWTVEGVDYPQPGSGDPNLSHRFPAFGSYTVTLKGTNICPMTATTRSIDLGLQSADILHQADTGICIGRSVALKTTEGPSFCWSPAVGLDDPNSAHPVATPLVTTQYTYTALIPGVNLVVNGDFSGGNTGFTSAYGYSSSNVPAGNYGVGPNPTALLPNSTGCSEHTGNGGNMLLVNAAGQPGVVIWSETVTVQPNTNYAFSSWLANVSTLHTAGLRFSVNGHVLGLPLTANTGNCQWDHFYTLWNSGNNGTAVIALVNDNTTSSGNELALDDLSFAPVTLQTDVVNIDVESPAVTAIPATANVCPRASLFLQASGSQTYSWSPASGLDDPAIANPLYQVAVSRQGGATTYTVTGTSARGCVAGTTVTINQLPELLAVEPGDTTICKGDAIRLNATGGGI